MSHPFSRREWFLAAILALAAAVALVYALNTHPTYLDAYYHASAANRLAEGKGLTDTAIWVYLGLPEGLPEPIVETPSHLYWMPATSLMSGAFMTLFGVSYAVARIPMALCLAGAILIAVLAGGWTGGKRWHAVLAGLLMVFSSSYIDKWGEIDTFAPYALFGAGALATMIYACRRDRFRWWLLAGLLSGASHLTRSDGLLMLMVGGLVIILQGGVRRPRALGGLLAGYLIVMLPWFVRMYGIVGAPLPLGGLQTAYLREYLQIFAYPWQDISLASTGIEALIQARVDALGSNLATFLVSEGWIIIWPFFLWGLFRAAPPIRLTVGLFALGLHTAMTLVFAWPGARGGLFHGAAALMPWWAALTPLGVEALARTITRWRPAYRPVATAVLMSVLLVVAVYGSSVRMKPSPTPVIIEQVAAHLTPADRALSVDPSRLYYHLGIGGTVLPYMEIDALPDLARTFAIDYMILEDVRTTDGILTAVMPEQLYPLLIDTPPFLELVADYGHARIYRFHTDSE